jgi:phosphonate transport system substrate-binding protein
LPFDRYQQIEPNRFQILAAPVMQASRYQNLPIYFADVIVRAGSHFTNLPDLTSRVFCYNDLGSNSGYNLLRHYLLNSGQPNHFFDQAIQSGSHQQSIRMVISGEADCAAIDSTVLEKEVQDLPELATQLRVIESLRSPMPPIVAARSLGADRIPQLQSALLQPDMNFKPLCKPPESGSMSPLLQKAYGLAQQYDAVTKAAYELS